MLFCTLKTKKGSVIAQYCYISAGPKQTTTLISKQIKDTAIVNSNKAVHFCKSAELKIGEYRVELKGEGETPVSYELVRFSSAF